VEDVVIEIETIKYSFLLKHLHYWIGFPSHYELYHKYSLSYFRGPCVMVALVMKVHMGRMHMMKTIHRWMERCTF